MFYMGHKSPVRVLAGWLPLACHRASGIRTSLTVSGARIVKTQLRPLIYGKKT